MVSKLFLFIQNNLLNSQFYGSLGHLSKAEDYIVAALFLLKNYSKINNNTSAQMQQGKNRRNSRIHVKSYQDRYQRFNSLQDTSLSLCLEVKRRCIRSIGLFSILRGDLLSFLTVFEESRCSNAMELHSGPLEDQVVNLALTTILYRLSDDYIGALNATQQMIELSQTKRRDHQQNGGGGGGGEIDDYHFTPELKGLLFFLVGWHYLADGNFQYAELSFRKSLLYYERLQNYSMIAAIGTLTGWVRFLLGKSLSEINSFLSEKALADSNYPSRVQKDQKIPAEDTTTKPFQSDSFLLRSLLKAFHRIQSFTGVPKSENIHMDTEGIKVQLFESRFIPRITLEKSIISTNYLTGMTGNPYWAIRIHQLLELTLISEKRHFLSFIEFSEWKNLFLEYFQGNPLNDEKIGWNNKSSSNSYSKNILHHLKVMLEKGNKIEEEEELMPLSNLSLEDNLANNLGEGSEAGRSKGDVLYPETILYSTSPIHYLHFFFLCLSTIQALKIHLVELQQSTSTIRNSPNSPSTTPSSVLTMKEKEIVELLIFLWIGLSQFSNIQEMTFPCLSYYFHFLEFELQILICSIPSNLFSSSRLQSVIHYLNAHYFNILPLDNKWKKFSQGKELLPCLINQWKERSNRFMNHNISSPSSSSFYPSQQQHHHHVTMLSELMGNFIDLNCRKNDSSLTCTGAACGATLSSIMNTITMRHAGGGQLDYGEDGEMKIPQDFLTSFLDNYQRNEIEKIFSR